MPALAAIPYTTFPKIAVGPIELQTFGLMVALGVVLGSYFGANHGEKYGMSRDETYRMATRLVIAGVIGARLTWVVTHLDQIENPVDVIAVWEGGLQFSGGFLAAIAVGLPTWLKWGRLQRWQLLDGYAIATVIGAAFGRIGCTAVGEHFGRTSSFFLATRYEGGDVREPTLGLTNDAPFVRPGLAFHNTAIYEGIVLFLMAGGLYLLLRRRPFPSTVGGVFLIVYSVSRFFFDSLRVNDERVAGLTGAQWMCLAMVPIGIFLLVKVRPEVAKLQRDAGAAAVDPDADTDADAGSDGTEDNGDDPVETAAPGRSRRRPRGGTTTTDGASGPSPEDPGGDSAVRD